MRLLAWLLAAYAVLGSILILVALLVGGPLVSRLDRMTAAAQGTMSSAADAADAAADAFDGFDLSLSEARISAADAASLSRETSATLDALASAMSLSLFGSQPLLPLADQFETSADQLRQLGDNLDAIGEALVANRDDVARVGVRMRSLAEDLSALEGRVEAEESASPVPLSWLYFGFLLWQLLPIIAAGVGAGWLFRHTRVQVVDPPQ